MGYLARRDQLHPRKQAEYKTGVGCATGFVAGMVCLASGIITSWGSPIEVILMAAAGLTAGVFLGRFLAGFRQRFDRESVQRRSQVYSALDRYYQYKGARTLAKNIDPVAIKVLEAGAFYWTQVMAALESPVWNSEGDKSYYDSVKSEILDAADHAMDELAVLGSHCIGKPLHTAPDDLKSAFEDLKELRFESALAKFGQATGGDLERYMHKSPNLKAIFDPAREVAEKLKLLSAEVERLTAERAHVPGVIGDAKFSSSRIDALVSNLRASRVAEQELSESSQKIE